MTSVVPFPPSNCSCRLAGQHPPMPTPREHKIGCGLNTEPAGMPNSKSLLVYHRRAGVAAAHRITTYVHMPVAKTPLTTTS